MTENKNILRLLNIILGFLSIGVFAFSLFVFSRLQPKMVAFEPLSGLEENLLTGVGFGLLVLLAFYLLSLLQIVRYVKHAERLRAFPLILIIASVLCVIFVFSDVALLSDIAKQYHAGFDQPEWWMVYPFMAGQSLVALVLTYLHVSGFFLKQQLDRVARDINIFLVVQYVGAICGLMGFALAGMGFFFQSGWSLPVHSVITSLTLIFPYGLAILYWFILKIREKDRVWWDEKQMQDVGKSALITLALDSLLMLGLFVFNIQNLAGVVRMLWLPFYIFGTITFFSIGNLFFSSRA